MHKKKLTIEQKIEIVKMYIENGESKTEIWQGSVEGAALKLPLGWEPHPRPRQRRMLRDFDNKQLPAVAWMAQPTASGQPASLARCA